MYLRKPLFIIDKSSLKWNCLKFFRNWKGYFYWKIRTFNLFEKSFSKSSEFKIEKKQSNYTGDFKEIEWIGLNKWIIKEIKHQAFIEIYKNFFVKKF